MYLHQSNNLNNGINLSSNHTLNHSLNMSDLHSDTYHQSSNNQSPNASNHYNLHHSTTDHQQNENHEPNSTKLIDDHYLTDTDLIKTQLSCSPISFATSTTLNNITNFSNLISNSNLNKQLNQLVDNKIEFDLKDSNCEPSKSTTFDVEDQNDLIAMDPLTRYLSLHPKYLELFDRFYNFLFQGDGPLHSTIRHYIAIMAAARHNCKYLVTDQQEQFKKVGGDVNWLLGIEYTPKKLQNLNEINKILAHQPWLMTKEHIERLTKGDKGEDNWSLSELVQAIVIMAQFHTLSSFVFGCGFADADSVEWSTKTSLTTPNSSYSSNNISDLLFFFKTESSAPPSPPSPNSLNQVSINDSGSECNPLNSNASPPSDDKSTSKTAQQSDQQANYLEILMRKMQNISEQKQQQFEFDNQEELVKNQSLEIHLTPNQTFNFNSTSVNGQSQKLNNSSSSNSSTNTSPSPSLLSKCLGNEDEQSDLSKFTTDSKFCYVDFARQRALTDVATFRVQDYSWSDHAYSLVNRLYSDVGTMLDEKMGRKTNVDTRVFRQAIWNYIQCMYGIRHDDYDYHEINELLERSLKTYIKTVCCFPHQTRRKDCDQVMREFRRSEKIHVNIMIAEARLQAELLYALRNISKYMT